MISGCYAFYSQVRIVEINGSKGSVVYFRIENRANNETSLSLTEDPDPCRSPDRSKDFVFRTLDPIAYYEVEGDRVDIYTPNSVSAPKDSVRAMQVEIHELTPVEYRSFKENRPAKLQLLQLGLGSESHSCSPKSPEPTDWAAW